MKSQNIFAALLAAVVFVGLAFVNVAEVSVDTNESYVSWKGYKVTGSHYGKVKLKEGNLAYENDQLVGGGFTIDMGSISVEDLSGNYAQKLEGHLKSPDFFGVEKYPTANFVITKVISRGTPGSYKVIGNLTIKETTKEIKFNAQIDEKEGKKVATADITVDRSEFDVRYGSGSFFDNLGDKTIYDEFELTVNLVSK